VDGYLPPYQFSRALIPANPISIGTLVSPDYFPEARQAHHLALLKAQEEILQADIEWEQLTQRYCGGLVQVDGPEEAAIGIVVLGSALGTLMEARNLYSDLPPVKLIKLRTFRPFPAQAIQEACAGLRYLIVIERAISPGAGGIVGAEIKAVLHSTGSELTIFNYSLGLGGRDIPLEIYPQLLAAVDSGQTEFRIFDVDENKLPAEDR
jgi:pyruvate ferredoxin oxidoreductase alpha subunit